MKYNRFSLLYRSYI